MRQMWTSTSQGVDNSPNPDYGQLEALYMREVTLQHQPIVLLGQIYPGHLAVLQSLI
jgi:hypothetical protein